MEKFIRKQNIERYRRLLGENPTEAERKVLERLLAEEEAKGHEKCEEEGQGAAIRRFRRPSCPFSD